MGNSALLQRGQGGAGKGDGSPKPGLQGRSSQWMLWSLQTWVQPHSMLGRCPHSPTGVSESPRRLPLLPQMVSSLLLVILKLKMQYHCSLDCPRPYYFLEVPPQSPDISSPSILWLMVLNHQPNVIFSPPQPDFQCPPHLSPGSYTTPPSAPCREGSAPAMSNLSRSSPADSLLLIS